MGMQGQESVCSGTGILQSCVDIADLPEVGGEFLDISVGRTNRCTWRRVDMLG